MDLAGTLRDTARRLPDKTAITTASGAVSYAELDARVDAAAGAFADLGLRPATGPHEEAAGDRVAIVLGNVVAFVEAFYGALRAGLVAVPVNALSAPAEILHVIADSGARALVVPAGAVAAVASVRDDVPDLVHVIAVGADDAADASWDDLLGRRVDPPAVTCDPAAIAVLQYTSGTTGTPAGARLTHDNLLANQRQMSRTRLALAESDVVLCVLPLFHIYALNVGMAFTLARGATILLIERFDPLATLQAVAQHRATTIIGAPPMYVAWVNTPGLDTLDLASVRMAVSGAAPLPVDVLQRFTDELDIPVWEGYGLSETSPVLTSVAMDDHPRPGSVGLPLPDVRIRLVDEHDRPVRAGDPGEVLAAGPNVFDGYWHDPERTAEAFDADGWFRTGDIGYVEDGHLHLVDRTRDLVIVSGFNVYPREVEEVLHRHPAVAQAAVVGMPHPYTGEAIKAVVVLVDGAEVDAAALRTHCAHHLARFKCPEVVEFTDALPVLPSGKVRRRELR